MREALVVKPYNFYSDIEHIRGRMANIFILLHNETYPYPHTLQGQKQGKLTSHYLESEMER